MLTLLGTRYRLCDGLSRRGFLGIGGLAVGGLTLPAVLRADAQAARRSAKSVIMIFLPGGPSHLDLVDLKPEAPPEVRGEFRPIATWVPGIRLCEHLPRLAAVTDRLAVIRSLVGGVDDHACHVCLTGHSRLGPQPAGDWPTFGAAVSRALGPAAPAVPPFISLAPRLLHPPYNDPGPGFLGAAHATFTPDGESRANLDLRRGSRWRDRTGLLARFDQLRRDIDASGMMAGMDAYQQRAFGVLTSSRLRDALDLAREDPKVRALYGTGTRELIPGFNAAPRLTEHFLLARRLVEAGARCVTVAFGAWDWHEKNFPGLRGQLPYLDQGLAALVTDLHQRGLDRDMAVVAWGEFGRSPRINQSAGRDHWPAVSCALLAGGGLRTGQALGSTNRLGEVPRERPVHVREVLATLYHGLGIDGRQTTFTDFSGRPHPLVDQPPIAELV
jgi:hypothetical protein